MAPIEWMDPPVENRRIRTPHDDTLEELKAHPGQWARVQKDMSSSGARQPWVERGCEVATRAAASGLKGKRDIYARWPAEGAERQAKKAAAPEGAASRPLPRARKPRQGGGRLTAAGKLVAEQLRGISDTPEGRAGVARLQEVRPDDVDAPELHDELPPLAKGSLEELADALGTAEQSQPAKVDQELHREPQAVTRMLPPGTRVKHLPVQGSPGKTRPVYELDGVTRPELPPEPTPIPEDETPGQKSARRQYDRLAVDRWKRGVTPNGKPARMAGK